MNTELKHIVVIDDNGAQIQRIQDVLSADSDILVVGATSDDHDWKQKITIDDYLVIVNKTDLKQPVQQLVDHLKTYFLYYITPIIVSTDNKRILTDKERLESPVLMYMPKIRDTEYLHRQLRSIIDTFASNRDQSPLTGLPANSFIDRQMDQLIASSDDFAMLYADLDNFKEFGEYYGFFKCNALLTFLSNLLYETFRTMGGPNDFIGHVGGDDFVLFIHDKDRIPAMGQHIIGVFDAHVASFYDDADVQNGYIEVRDRQGQLDRFPIMTISLVVIDSTMLRTMSRNEAYIHIMAQKKKAKLIKGSTIV